MAAEKKTLKEKEQEKETNEQEDEVEETKDVEDKEENGENKQGAEEMNVDKQEEGEEESEKEEKEKIANKEEKGGAGKEEEGKSDDVNSPTTPGSRPTRERKTVERYFESLAARGSTTKSFSIDKGRGTQLKDIPNVAYMLSKRKPDDNLQILHSILYGKKTKTHNLRKNIGQFSGYVWVENELEKNRAKVKEKLDKCVKEKLLVFCDILNIPVSRSATKKDELTVKLLDFLESPHSTTDLLLADKEQKSKKLKRKGRTSKSKGSLDKAAGKSSKKHQKSAGEKRKRSPKIEEEESNDEPSSTRDESGDGNDDEETNEVRSDQEESGSEEEEEEPKNKKSNGKVSLKKDSGNKVTEKPKATRKDNPTKSPKSSTKSTKVSSSTSSKRGTSSDDSLASPKKQKVEKKSQKEENGIAKENVSNKKQLTKSPAKVSEKEVVSKSPGIGKENSDKKAKAEPSNEEIHAAAVNILKEVDFNSATLSDIIRQLGSHFNVDLMLRKAEVKAIITDVINNMSDEEGDDLESGDDEEKNEGDA